MIVERGAYYTRKRVRFHTMIFHENRNNVATHVISPIEISRANTLYTCTHKYMYAD